MANWDNNNEDNESGLNEIEQMQLDAVILDTAYNNSYLVLSGQITFDELMGQKFKTGTDAIMAYDPETGPRKEELENMISYYIEEEMYERCSDIKKLLNNKYPETDIKLN
tara:strand:+ start:525 stop:854 length:330 start_codon:yes stop_codon:yes gene_type:complete